MDGLLIAGNAHRNDSHRSHLLNLHGRTRRPNGHRGERAHHSPVPDSGANVFIRATALSRRGRAPSQSTSPSTSVRTAPHNDSTSRSLS